MTIQLGLYRHQWDAAGSGDAQSIQNAMGKTSLDMWNVLLRETLQNSWDARLQERIRFDIAEKELTTEQTDALLHQVFSELPPEGKSRDIRQKTSRGRMRVLTIADRQTRGLGGPIRANIAPAEGQRTDFADFIRNFGRSHSKGLEGGTYGLGKGVLYSASRIGVCLVYSQPRINGAIEPRLIAVSGGDSDYVQDGYKFTGRNWWGVIADDGVVDPLIGVEARLLAQTVGMPVPESDESGTSIMILAPEAYAERLGNVELDARVQALREAAVTWAWPHAVDLGAGPSVDFSFSIDGLALAPIEPSNEPLVRHFVKAYQELERWQGGRSKGPGGLSRGDEVRSQRPKRLLGHLVARHVAEVSNDDEQLMNTVALMRSPKLIVKYMPISAPPAEGGTYAVFKCHPDVDTDFAQAEPVTHDDWIAAKNQKARQANFVNIALNRIREFFSVQNSSTANASGADQVQGASHISSALGTLMGSFTGRGASVPSANEPGPTSPPGPPPSRRASAQLVRPPYLLQMDGTTYVGFPYAIKGGKSGERFALRATAKIVVDGGGTERDEGPARGSTPDFAGWLVGREREVRQIADIEIPAVSELTAVFIQPEDTAVKATLELIEVAT
ncbi:hypothetical protein ACX8Z9_14185 [Arthrobacter halodurans]|uniref:Histidine kinase-, DNA gyrase B-, and HSP90-like ATPase n=1 Tax=Arthrobacter halodurans TaxID=516699 RepID=A0ABV4UT64_9MICC